MQKLPKEDSGKLAIVWLPIILGNVGSNGNDGNKVAKSKKAYATFKETE